MSPMQMRLMLFFVLLPAATSMFLLVCSTLWKVNHVASGSSENSLSAASSSSSSLLYYALDCLVERTTTNNACRSTFRALPFPGSFRENNDNNHPQHFVCKKPGTMWQNYEHHHRMEAIPPAVLLRKLLQKETFYDWGVHAGGATMI